MYLEKDQIVHEDIIFPDGSTDNQDDARLNEYFEELKEWEKQRKVKKEKLFEEKLEVKSSEKEMSVEF